MVMSMLIGNPGRILYMTTEWFGITHISRITIKRLTGMDFSEDVGSRNLRQIFLSFDFSIKISWKIYKDIDILISPTTRRQTGRTGGSSRLWRAGTSCAAWSLPRWPRRTLCRRQDCQRLRPGRRRIKSFYCVGYVGDLVKIDNLKQLSHFCTYWKMSLDHLVIAHWRALSSSHVYKRREEDIALRCLLTMCILSSSNLSVSKSKNFCAHCTGDMKTFKQICYFPFLCSISRSVLD